MPTISCIRVFFRVFAIHFIHNDILLLSHYRAPARALRSTEETNTKNKFKTKLHTQKKQGSLSPAGLTDPPVLPLAKKEFTSLLAAFKTIILAFNFLSSDSMKLYNFVAIPCLL